METSTEGIEEIQIGSKTEVPATCSFCGKTGTGSNFFTYQDVEGKDTYLCSECRVRISDTLTEESKNVPLGTAFFTGLVAALLGAVAWYYITVFSEREFGYVAIGLGYLVGYGVLFGSGQRRSHKLQIMSALFVVFGIFIAEYAIFHHSLHTYMIANPTEFEQWDGVETIWLDPWASIFLESFISPIGLLIYAIGVYVGYAHCKPLKV